jgi:prevent-host-death family protein
MMYIMQNISVADTRQHLAEILGKVAYGGKAFLITKKGRPMARLVPVGRTAPSGKKTRSVTEIKGWLEDDDPFFKHLELIREASRREKPRNPFLPKKSFK